MKATIAGAALAAGLTAVAAEADSPLTDAFAPYLGSCWSAPLNELPEPETYCFDELETGSVRILHSVAGPHGMHYGEEILHWNAAEERIISRYLNNTGGVVDSDGAIIDGAPVLYSYNDWDGGLQLRIHWGAVSGDEAVFVREQFLGEDYGGWNTEEPRSFTRAGPVSDFDPGAGGDYPRGSTIEAFGPLIGQCWTAVFEGSESLDIHCFSTVFGVHVRDRHIVPGPTDYTGETLFHTDASGQLHFRYFNSINGVSDGTGEAAEDGIVFGDETYTGNDGVTRRFRGRYSNITEDGYESVTEELTENGWEVVSRQSFRLEPDNPFD
ncbi:hypothetical protein [Hyphobacterium marinum]|uniref:MORN repeat-containing protein n=1 Tax=Hyphobacterium marinum TaxID=3116574 RepID=A0ABU7M2W5_9PROT|nr:hypothetical protein [Hyphobacterium sp. Y6023]MEE2567600.1 hypothetical protein [Hyphobacterium sp. Y6023]